jgi:cytochrome c oxidase assembly protein subunit 20
MPRLANSKRGQLAISEAFFCQGSLPTYTMADDTRQTEASQVENGTEPEIRRPRRPKPKHDFPKTQAGKLWEAFGNPEEPVNTMPGGMVNSAGGRPPEITWRDAFKNPFATKDGRRFYEIPCAKDSLLVGISTGGAVGGVRFILKG